MSSLHGWFYWALLSAAFAALTAIFAKIGLEGVDSDFATLIRTSVIGLTLTGFVYCAGKWSNPFALRPKTWVFLALSGLATGASWVGHRVGWVRFGDGLPTYGESKGG